MLLQNISSCLLVDMGDIPEDMKLQSLTLESKPHLALETLCIFNQNRTMANVQYMPFNPFRSYVGPRPIV